MESAGRDVRGGFAGPIAEVEPASIDHHASRGESGTLLVHGQLGADVIEVHVQHGDQVVDASVQDQWFAVDIRGSDDQLATITWTLRDGTTRTEPVGE